MLEGLGGDGSQPELLLTDVILPKMNGRELATGVTRRYPQTKVLYMSGYTDNHISHHQVLDMDMNFILKPFSVKELASKIRKVLDHSG